MQLALSVPAYQFRARAIASAVVGLWLAAPSVMGVAVSPVAKYTLRQNSMMFHLLGIHPAQAISSLGPASASTILSSLLVFPWWLVALNAVLKKVPSGNLLSFVPTLSLMSIIYASCSQLPGLLLASVRQFSSAQVGTRLVILWASSMWMIAAALTVTAFAAWPKYRLARAVLSLAIVLVVLVPRPVPAGKHLFLMFLPCYYLGALIAGEARLRVMASLCVFIQTGICLTLGWISMRRARHVTPDANNA